MRLNSWAKLRYKNLTLLAVCILLVIVLDKWPPFQELLSQVHTLGYLGAFIGGILFVFTFTVALGGVILFNLLDSYPLWSIALVAALGSVVGDFFIFRFVKDGLTSELKPIYNHLGGEVITKFFRRAYLRWALLVIGAIIVASPLPDEIGVSLMGMSKMKVSHFIVISFFLDVIGIFILFGGLMMMKNVA